MESDELMLRLDRNLPLLVHRIVHRTRASGIGPAAMMTLRRLSHASPCTVSELAGWMGVTSATVTGITNKLAAQNLIERTRNEKDRRVVYINVTQEGKDVLREIERSRREGLSGLLSRLSQQEQRILVELIERLLEPGQE